jgi:hypothetical protein
MTVIEVDTEYKTAHRFPAWVALSVFSAICLAATSESKSTSQQKYVLSVTIISMCLAFFSACFYLLARKQFVGTQLEIGTSALVLLFWAIGLGMMMNPAKEIAISTELGIVSQLMLQVLSASILVLPLLTLFSLSPDQCQPLLFWVGRSCCAALHH